MPFRLCFRYDAIGCCRTAGLHEDLSLSRAFVGERHLNVVFGHPGADTSCQGQHCARGQKGIWDNLHGVSSLQSAPSAGERMNPPAVARGEAKPVRRLRE